VILFVTVAASYYLSVRKKPSLIAVFVALTLGVGVMGFIGMTRNYFSGLSLERASKSGPAEFLESGFQEAVIFMTSGMIISRIPSPRYDFIYLDPIIEAISIPIPRKIWADKPSGDHIQYVYEVYNPGNSGVSKGSAWLVFGEFYLMYGWPSIVVCSLFLGWLLKRLFLWMKNNIHNPYVIVIYSTALGSLYFVISRGYFPQHVMLFFFTVFPGYLLSRNSK
jgi:oligosaccharide repeat unit polymerase